MGTSQKSKGNPVSDIKSPYGDNWMVDDTGLSAQEFKTYVTHTASNMERLPGSFGATLAYHMDKLHLTNEAMSKVCLINEDTIRRYRNGSNKSKPSIQTVVALCVGLKLPLTFCFDLVHKAGFIFTSDPSDIAYQTILCNATRLNIYQCNQLLRDANIPQLVKEK